MSRKKAWLASSLTVCSASTCLAMSSNQSSVAHADGLGQTQPRLDQETDVNKSLYQFLKPVSDRSMTSKTEVWQQTKMKPIVHQVRKGDNLYRIGLYYGVHYEVLAAYNNLTDPDQLYAGQKLQIPLQPKWIKSPGKETAKQLATKYRSTTELITDLNPFFREQDMTQKGQWILIPKPLQTSPKLQQLTQPQQNPQKKKTHKILKFSNPKPKQTTARTFLWPVKGQITSKFGWRHGRRHNGIDIWSAEKSQALIYSAKDGVVTRSGYTSGYGNLVVIDHGHGWVTYYAHLSRISVGKGQHIRAGEVVGNMGQTGNATGYHLHFEIRKNGEALNPLSILP